MDLRQSQPVFEKLAPGGYYVALRVGFSSPEDEINCLDQGWIDLYTQLGLYVHDPAMRWVYSNFGAIRWSEIDLPDPIGVISLSRQMKLGFGASVSFSRAEDIGKRSYAVLFHPDREFEDAELNEALDALRALHHVPQVAPSLTPAEAEAIRMRASGLRLKQIAAELEISESAVKARIASACRKFDAKNPNEMLAIAAARRLV
ncbi:LuxR family transcriptional regulator [Thioclava sp. BHET1]|uniref:LuxR family transcriptional regulator n=1 Tax=Thioclava dalianensis TaxID=1185766 RepID=A0A074TD63_9RHOB|nr:LuxR family transcriptional regulator [Thioclava dalianensis]KEP69716.1 LuxR family transcriptional regulator [Thioclava dalianensis]TMV94614.1 LuxR family transcriptional regulator [Thioclava sp. BHET1]SFM93378.1 LuxR family transcriptional regulator [Thioclava dalianensis]